MPIAVAVMRLRRAGEHERQDGHGADGGHRGGKPPAKPD